MNSDHLTSLRPVTGIVPAVRARWWLVPLGLLLGLAAGFAAAVLVPPSYQATATVRVGAGLVPVGQLNPSTSWVEDQIVLARTEEVFAAVADELGEDPDAVEDRLAVAQRGGASYLDLTYRASTGGAAERGADTAAATYLELAQADAEQRWQDQVDLLQRLVAAAPATQQAGLRSQLRALQQTVVDPGRLVEGATVDGHRATIDPVVFPLAGALGGLLLGAALAYLLEARAPRVRSRPGPDLDLATLGRLDRDGDALAPVAGRLAQLRLPAGRQQARLGVAVVGPDRRGLVDSVRERVGALLPDREVRTVPVDLSTGDGLLDARGCDELLLLAVEGRTSTRVLEQVTRRLDLLDLRPLGLVTVPRRWRAS